MKLGGIESKFNFQLIPPTPRAYKPQKWGGVNKKKNQKVSNLFLLFFGPTTHRANYSETTVGVPKPKGRFLLN